METTEMHEAVRKLRESQPEMSESAISRKLDISRRQVRNALGRKQAPKVVRAEVSSARPRGAMPLDKFLAPFDEDAKIEAGLNELGKGAVIDDESLRRHLGVSQTRWRIARDREKWGSCQLKVNGKLFWGLPPTLAEARKTIDMVED